MSAETGAYVIRREDNHEYLAWIDKDGVSHWTPTLELAKPVSYASGITSLPVIGQALQIRVALVERGKA